MFLWGAYSSLPFIIVISNLDQNPIENVNVVLYTDDITIYFISSSLDGLQNIVDLTLLEFYTWCSNNELIINSAKSNYIFFREKREVQSILLKLNNSFIVEFKVIIF